LRHSWHVTRNAGDRIVKPKNILAAAAAGAFLMFNAAVALPDGAKSELPQAPAPAPSALPGHL
jgi:hypothetical protein